MPGAETDGRPALLRNHQLYLGGGFADSESGRVYPVTDHRGSVVANAALASRKDVRDAVDTARAAAAEWAGTGAYQRGQVLYRIAELLEERRDQFATAVTTAEGWPVRRAAGLVDAAVERWTWYAGWADKIASVLGSANPAAGFSLCVSEPEPAGVVGVLAPQASALLGLAGVLAPVLATGNAAVVVASQHRPLPALALAEVLASSELPGGVVNVLTGRTAELAPWLAAHTGVNGLDLVGAPQAISVDLARTAAGTVKRVLPTPAAEPDWTRPPDLRRLRTFVDIRTIWLTGG